MGVMSYFYTIFIVGGSFQIGLGGILVCWLFSFLMGQNTLCSDSWTMFQLGKGR